MVDKDEEDLTTPDTIIIASHMTTSHTTTVNTLGNTIQILSLQLLI